tara:strand:- start:3723 stop:7607 length:3885 start_codon:yes stop_codon:yes gene_type:complete
MAENPIYEQKNITFFISKDTFENIPNKVTKIIVRYENVYSLPPKPVGSILDIKNNNEPLKYVFFNPDNDKRLDDYQKAVKQKADDTDGDSSDDYNNEIILVNFKNKTGEEISGDSMITLTHPIFLNKITIQNPYKSIGIKETVRLHLRGTIDTENPGNNSVKFPNFQVESNNIDRSNALINLEKKDKILENFTLEDIRKNIIHFENNADLVKDPLASLLDTYKLAKSLGLTKNEYPDVTFAEKEQFFIKNRIRKRIYYEKDQNIEQYINQDNLKENDKSIIDVNGNEKIHKFDDKYFIYVFNSTLCSPKELKYNEKYGLIYSNFNGNIDRIDVTSKLFNYQELDKNIVYRLKMIGLNGQESNSNIHVLTLKKLKEIKNNIELLRVYLTKDVNSNTNVARDETLEINNIIRYNLYTIDPKIKDKGGDVEKIQFQDYGEITIPDELFWEITWLENTTPTGGGNIMIGGGITRGQKKEIYEYMNYILNLQPNVFIEEPTPEGAEKMDKMFEDFYNALDHFKSYPSTNKSKKNIIKLISLLKKLKSIILQIRGNFASHKDVEDFFNKKIKKTAKELKYKVYIPEDLDSNEESKFNDLNFKQMLKKLYDIAKEEHRKFLKNAKYEFYNNHNLKEKELYGINNYGQTFRKEIGWNENFINNEIIITNAKKFIELQKNNINDIIPLLNKYKTKKDLFRWILEWSKNENPERKGIKDLYKTMNITSGNYVDKLLKSLKDLIREVNKKEPTDIPKKMFNYMNILNESIYYSDEENGKKDFNQLIESFQVNLKKLSNNISKISEDYNFDNINEQNNNVLKQLKREYHYLFNYKNIFIAYADETIAVRTATTPKTTATTPKTTATALALALAVSMAKNSGQTKSDEILEDYKNMKGVIINNRNYNDIFKNSNKLNFDTIGKEIKKAVANACKEAKNNGWISCMEECNKTLKKYADEELKSTQFILRVLAKSIIDITKTDEEIKKGDDGKVIKLKYIVDHNLQGITGIWEKDNGIFSIDDTFHTEKPRLIMAFGPSASGKTYSGKKIMQMIAAANEEKRNTSLDVFPKKFLTIDGGIYREESFVYQKILEVLNSYECNNIVGFKNLVSKKIGVNKIFSTTYTKKNLQNWLNSELNKKKISLYIPETLGFCGLRDCSNKYSKYKDATGDKKWIGLLIWQHLNNIEENDDKKYGKYTNNCDYLNKCKGTYPSGKEREKKEGKLYSPKAWNNSMINGEKEMMKATGGRIKIHNSGDPDNKSKIEEFPTKCDGSSEYLLSPKADFIEDSKWFQNNYGKHFTYERKACDKN